MGRGKPIDSKSNEDRPSSAVTSEFEALTSEKLVDRQDRISSVPPVPNPPPSPEPTRRVIDDLAQTMEAPATPRIVILEAADDLVAEVGFDRLTEGQIAQRANVELDIVHALFGNKHALLRALTERFCSQAIQLTDEATRSGIWTDATPEEVVEVAVRSILDIVLGRAALIRTILASSDSSLVEELRRVGANVTSKLARVLHETRGDPKDKPDPRDIAFALLQAVSLAHHIVLVGPEWSGLEFERQEIYERAASAASAYVAARSRSC